MSAVRPQRGADLDARTAELRRLLEYHGHRYYVLDDPEIGDDAYDALIDELRAIEADHPELVTPDSPTQRVGGEPVSDLEKVRHPQEMLSLANARSADELRAWNQRMRNHLAREGIEDPKFEYVVEPKIDGLKPLALCTGTASSSGGRRAATARSARTSPTTCARSPRFRASRHRPPAAANRSPRRGVHVAVRTSGSERASRRGR